MEETRRRLAAFLNNEEAFLKYATRVSIKERTPIPLEDFRAVWQKNLSQGETDESLQEQFAAMLDRWKEIFDLHLYGGQWNVLNSQDHPFVIGDNPVVTWKLDGGNLSFGVGIHVPGAEVYVPVSPTACLQILPAGSQRPRVSRPTSQQVNEVQVMFMTRRVYAQSLLPAVDELVQRKGGILRMGVNCFLTPQDDELDFSRIMGTI